MPERELERAGTMPFGRKLLRSWGRYLTTQEVRRSARRIRPKQLILSAASPLHLLLVIGLWPRFGSIVGAQVDANSGGSDSLGWRTFGRSESWSEASQQHQRRRLVGVSANVVLSESTISAAENGAEAVYTVALNSDPGTTLQVDIGNGNSAEISTSVTSLEFTSANWNTAQAVTVTALDDGEVEDLTVLTLTHSVIFPLGDGEWTGTFFPSEDLSVRVYDNDEAGILISASTVYVDEGSTGTYNIKLMGSPSEDVKVTAIASDANLIVSTSMPLTFTWESWDSAQTITVSGVDDAIQTSESYTTTVTHTATSVDALFEGSAVVFFPSAEVSVIIYDNDNGCYRSCDPGSWAFPYSGTYECASCNPGYYCPGTCSDPSACPVGTSVVAHGSSSLGDCQPCNAGYYSSEEGSASCLSCPAGYSCSVASAAPVSCLKGTYSSVGALECTECANGYYNALTAQEFCQSCPSGSACLDKTSAPSECSLGSYSYGNATTCEPCPPGYYCSSTGSSPNLCPEGSFSLGGWDYCFFCPPGSYCINTSQESTICEAGTFSLGGLTSCTTCPNGTYSSLKGSTQCTQCPAGSSCTDVSANPMACTNGTYSHVGHAICSGCDAGTYSFEGASSCRTCPVGYSCFNPVSSPTLCSDGHYSSGGIVLSCAMCAPGTTTDATHDKCIACSEGYQCSEPIVGEVLCEQGYYSGVGVTACTECPAGSYCSSPFSSPQACSSGTYTTSGSTSCTLCPGGYYCSPPSDLPDACLDGEYSAEGASTCTTCPAGSFCPGPLRDQDSKAPCPGGQYSLGGKSSCSGCPKGYYCPDASQAPVACPTGYFADAGNMTACNRCTAGNYCQSSAMPAQACPLGYYSQDGASECTQCPPGFSCATTASSPVACSPGTSSGALATNCTSCSPGYYCPNTDSVDFYECPQGTYSTGDASSCTVCSAGYYCPHTTVELEVLCPNGYYSGGGGSSCTTCAAGFSCESDGSGIIACTPGFYSQTGTMTCISCPAGHYCPDTTSGTILECPAGSYSEGSLQVCVECQAGYYCPQLDSAQSLPCLSGTYSVGGQATCIECPAGSSCSSTVTDQSIACGEGYYSLFGDPECTACPAGYRCPHIHDSPVLCDPGYFSTATSVNCTSCPAGYFCDDPEAPPSPCEVGYYSGGGTLVCLVCQPGYHCPEASVGATPTGSECPEGTYCNPARTITECPAGTYGNVTAAPSLDEGCQACTEGYYCTDTGNTLGTRKICPAGYYCPVGSSSPTGCAAGLYSSLIGQWSNNVCTACEPGFYCKSGSASGTSTICPAGNYCPASTPSSTSYPCPAGTYSSSTGLVDPSPCLACTVGSYCPEGSTAPTDCVPGTYQPFMSATDASACLACEPGWACPSTGMWEMTTLCSTGSYCPSGTAYATQYACDAGTYTDSTNLTSANQCSPCPERKVCLPSSTSVDWGLCGAGYFCPEGTPSTTSHPCLAGSFTNRTDLAAASECYPCPLGFWCGGSGSSYPDGSCAPGYYCPLSTAAATNNPCPAGTYSNSSSLYLESQCQDCPPGYYCPEASTTTEPCPAGTYSPYNATEDEGPGEFKSCMPCTAGSYCVEASTEPVSCGKGLFSDEGADECSVCTAGYYCGSNQTEALTIQSGGGSWDSASDVAGMCFNGTYCAAGMDRAPDLLRDSCIAGYYCPAGAEHPFACPSGTYNPHKGMDDEDDCQTTPAGYYTIEASTNMTGPCSAGYYCPAASTGPQQVPCPERYYRSSAGGTSQDDCALCVSGGYCTSGLTEPINCPRGQYCVTGVSEAEPCPLGTYGNTTGLRKIQDCTYCDPGHYCDQRGLTLPAGLCDPGYYCLDGSYTSAPSAPGSPLSPDDSDVGGLCPPGGYCPIGSSYQQPCPAGTFNNFSGAAEPEDCSECPPGFYCSGTSNPDPTGVCDPGFYCTGGSSTSIQNRVDAGHYSPSGSSTQYPCEAGTFNQEQGQQACTNCSAGYYCQNQNTTEPTLCPVGSYCPEGSDNHILCPVGTYSPLLGLDKKSQCTKCDPGKFCSSNGLTEVSGDCAAGHYCTNSSEISTPSTKTYGDVCTPGHYCAEGSPWPKPCPLGTFYGSEANTGDIWHNDSLTGQPYRSYCFLCPATYACNTTGLSAGRELCSEGYFCKLGAKTTHPYCEAGEGLCDYGVCPAGHFCPTGTSEPTVCLPGTYMNNTGATECFQCPERYYCDGSNPRGYAECLAGDYCPTGTGPARPKCPAGTYSTDVGLASASECTNCTAGLYCAGTSLTTPDGSCAAGYYCPSGSQNSHGKTSTEMEHACPAGSYCTFGVDSPSFCPVGTFNPLEGITAEEDCLACTIGNYCASPGLVTHTGPCDSGYYCKQGVRVAAPTIGISINGTLVYGGDACPKGTYCPSGTDTPLACEAGTFNALLGQEECFPCPAGYFCMANATGYEENPCPAGYYCLEGTQHATQYSCPVGTYSEITTTSLLSDCVDAPAGMYVSGSAQIAVTGSCAEGFFCTGGSSSATPFCNDTATGECLTGGACRAGQYCPPSSSEALACPGGKYCASSDGTITGECNAGSFCNQGSSTPAPRNVSDKNGIVGDICPAGFYCETGSAGAEACPSGTYSPSVGNMNLTACLPCQPGFLCPDASMTDPTEPCPAGYYCLSGTIEAIFECDAGHACPNSSWEATPCEAGTFQGSTGQGSCLECPEGSYCLLGAETPTDCPAGSYCPAGTRWGTQYPCPIGMFSNVTKLVHSSGCSTCSAGSYCSETGLDAPTGLCAEGFYCSGGATLGNPDSSYSDGYRGDTCVDRTNSSSNDLCPPGHFCPAGSPSPKLCPKGTSSSSFGLISQSDCAECAPGFFCPESGASNATVECFEGFFCPGGDQYPTRECLQGHYCPPGSAESLACVAGTYENDTGSSGCDICPYGHFCEERTAEPSICPAGYFCPEGTETSTEHPCPKGTYSSNQGLATSSECSLCSHGRFCGTVGLDEPEGLCGPGYYCALGATSPVPENGTDPSVAGQCAGGYACVEGAGSPQPVDGTTGYKCPSGTYCSPGSSAPIGCPPGFYNPSEAMEECTICPAGRVCAGNTTYPDECPIYHYCPAGSTVGDLCPAGKHGSRTGLQEEDNCQPCPAGHFCIDGNITSTCRAGYFCKTGIDNPTPNSIYANYSYEDYNLIWESLNAGPCPAGHYCPPGTEDPRQCANASVRKFLLGVSADDCGACSAGEVCYPGNPIPEECPKGYYCPEGEDPISCPIGTFNAEVKMSQQDKCLSCPEGSYCSTTGIGDFTQYPCPAGHYCLEREYNTIDCPPGTYQNGSRAAAVEDCDVCPGGFQCSTGTITPDPCPEKTYCLAGASNTTTCPAGFYCPVKTDSPVLCPQGYYCPLGSSEPTICELGTFCLEGSEIFTSCPLGWYGSTNSNNTFWSQDVACVECQPGTFGTDPDRLVCEICIGGYVCLGTTSSATPLVIEDDGGFKCTAGHYCPEGSWEEIDCLPGSYNAQTGSFAASDCLICAADHYQDQAASSSCLPCSTSSTSEANATECLCLGLNRAFQLSDGQCICRSGYEYYNEGGVLVSTVDGAIDCQPIVYERCYTGEALDADGECISESDCETQCGDTGGTFYEQIGLCECQGVQDLNAVCDANCRDGATTMFIDPFSGLIVVIDGNTTEYVDPTDLPGFEGALYCSNDAGCSLFPMRVSTNFTGIYGVGDAVATSSASPLSRKRHLTVVEEDDQREGRSLGDMGYIGRHRGGKGKYWRGGTLVSEADMTAKFLRMRADNYRPRNQYRDRFFDSDGMKIAIPGAIPKAQRLFPLSKHEYRHFEDDRPLVEEKVLAGEAGKQQTRRGRKRKLVGGVADEPAVAQPLTCVNQGDSVLFDISSGCYPVYDKDSLLNSNVEFDFGEFRSVAELAASSATYVTFGFVFEEPATYVFSSSCNSLSIFVLVVMAEAVSCTTEAQFVPMTASNLIMLGVGKNSEDITLSPDWALIGGLLAGIAFMILGVISAVYYFRTKAWATGQAPVPTYRSKAMADHLEGTDDNSRQKPGFFSRRQSKVAPSGKNSNRTGSPRSRLSASRDGVGSIGSDDPEMQAGLDRFNAQDDPNVRELVDRIQKYHDVVEKEFMGQKDLVLKLHHLLEQEADELKRLFGARAGTMGGQPSGVDENATRVTLLRLKADLASRRLHENAASTSEVEALSALRRLQELLHEGAGPFAARVVLEVASPEIGGKASHSESRASTPLLREIAESTEHIRMEVVHELGERLEREKHREHRARTALEAAVSRGGVVLPEEIVRTLKTMSEMEARVDGGERGVSSTLRRLADRLPACSQELVSSEGLILRNLARIRAMGNTSLEDAEQQRGTHAIAKVLEQLNQALTIVAGKAEAEKAAVDAARIDAEVERAYLESAVDKSIKALGLSGTGLSEGGVPPATSDDLQGMLKELRCLVSTSATSAAAAPSAAASALFSQIAATEYRRHSAGNDTEVRDSIARLVEEEAEEAVRRSEVEANLLAEQEAGVAAVVAVAETEKKGLEEELEHAGATIEEKETMMGALADDQRVIEDVLEAERLRVEESLRAAATARKARDDRHAEEDAVQESQTKAELLHQQSAQIQELRRTHEEAQLAIVGESIDEPFGTAYSQEDWEENERERTESSTDEQGLVADIRKIHAEQIAVLEASLAAKANTAQSCLRDQLHTQRANCEADLIQQGASASDAAIKADRDLAAKEASNWEALTAKLTLDRKNALKAETLAQRQVRDEAKTTEDAAAAAMVLEKEIRRIREKAAEALQAVEDALAEEGKARRKALRRRLKAKRRGKEAELAARGAGEDEFLEQEADLTRLEELETEVLDEKLQSQREFALKEVRACAAAADAEAVIAMDRTKGVEGDAQAMITSSKIKELHLAAIQKLEHDLGKNEINASKALRDRLVAARTAREKILRGKESFSASEATATARRQLEDEEEKAQEALIEGLAADRLEAIGRANKEAEAAAVGANIRSMREEADRLLAEHRDRTEELREAIKADGKRQKQSLQKRLAARRQATDAIVATAKPISENAAAQAIVLVDAAEEAERGALERCLADEAVRFEDDVEGYERLLVGILSSGEDAAKSAAAIAEAEKSGETEESTESPVGAGAKAAMATAQAKKESLRHLHEREIAAMALQNESKRRAIAIRLAQRRAAAKEARAEAMRADGKDEEEIAKKLAEEDARATEQENQQDILLEAAGVAGIEDERAWQMFAVEENVDPRKEAARIRARHARDLAMLEKELDKHRRDQKAALASRLRKRRAAKAESLRLARAGEEETAAAMKALDFQAEKDAIQLEETLLSNENVEITAAKQAYAHASGKDELTGSGLAELRARHQESELLLKESLRAESGARRARMHHRIAKRVTEREKELKEEGRSAGEIAAENAAIRAAGKAEEHKLEALLVTESEARIHAFRQSALAVEAVLETKYDETRELRELHEKAAAKLAVEIKEKKRRGKEAVAVRLQERKAKRAAELKSANVNKEEIAGELSRLDQEAKCEEEQVEEEIEQEAALLAESERNLFAKREAEARAAQLAAETSRRAGELEAERLRREYEVQQRILEEAQENQRKARKKALADMLARRRQKKMKAAIAASESFENQQKLAAEMEYERIAAQRKLDEEIFAEICEGLQERANKQARAEAAARTSAQDAVDEAEKRARLAREEHERSTNELDKQMAAAKVAQSAKLKGRLAERRRVREEQLKHENADAAAVKAARKQLKEEEARELYRLDDHLQRERKRLHAENFARAAAKRTREEAEARDKATAAAAAAAAAKHDADNYLRRLQKQHIEQHAALESQMKEERRSRESKLRDRLSKRRQAKEEDMRKSAMSEREKDAEKKRLEGEESTERQRFQDQLEEEMASRIDTQRRQHEEALATAAAETERVAEMAAVAAARAAAADAMQEAVNAAEQEGFKRKAQKLKELSQANEEKAKLNLAGSSATNKSKLMERLAKKKARAEAQKRKLEAAQKDEEKRLREKHKEEAEAAKAATAPGWSGDIAWDEAVAAAMSEPPREREAQSEREARVLKSVLEADIVPDNKIGKCVELVMSWRHDKETSDLLTAQYKERASKLAVSLSTLLAEKNRARTDYLQRLAKTNANTDERAKAVSEIDDEFAGRQQELEMKIIQELEPVHLEQQLALRQKQLREVAGTVKCIAPESALKRLQEIAKLRQEEELERFHHAMEREKEERLKRVQEERARFEEDLRRRHKSEMQRLQAEEDKVMDVEREAQEARMTEKKAELERERVEDQRRMEERAGKLDTQEKEALLEQFKRDQAAALGDLKAEESTQKNKLEQKLAARRKKKMEELRKREEKELKIKGTRDAQALRDFENQANIAAEAEATALSTQRGGVGDRDNLGGLKVDIDKKAIKLAREAGIPNEAKERLKQTMAESESRKHLHRHGSVSKPAVGAGRGSLHGGGAAAAAAAAASAAATATAYTHISTKLEGIEALISALKAAQRDQPLPGSGASSSREAYRDAEDAATIPEGNELQVISREKLPIQALVRLEFGEHLLSVLGLENTVKLEVAKNLPPASSAKGSASYGQGGGRSANAFRNSYMWNTASGVLYLHVRRISSSGDFGLVLVHAAAHIQVDPSDMSNDLDPRFTQYFHRALKVLTQELFKYRGGAAPAADAGIGPRSPLMLMSTAESTLRTPTSEGGDKSQVVLGLPPPIRITQEGSAQKGFVDGAGGSSREFAQDAFAERMERYAKASGHPRLVELLSRHASQKKEKFILSDDEDQISNVDDAAYMEQFDNGDVDSIFGSPVGSINAEGGHWKKIAGSISPQSPQPGSNNTK